MGFSRKRKGSDDSGDEVVSKKSRSSGALPTKQTGEDGNPYWEISGKRRVQISEFKGMQMVNIREFYEKDGKTLPGKAGINLPIEQFKTFLSLLPQLLAELEDKGIEIEPPTFGAGSASKAETSGKKEKAAKPRKSNIEATSDEDEEADENDLG